MSRFPNGVSEEAITVVARRVLLDAVTALQDQAEAITLVGAQAVHLRTIDDIVPAAYTSDADLGIDPRHLGDKPLLEETMQAAGFSQGPDPGHWHRPERIGDRTEEVVVDLMVAAEFSGTSSNRRSAAIPPHARIATRRTPGLEAAAVDYDVMPVPSLEPITDARVLHLRVAGTAALLIAKGHKLDERAGEDDGRRLVAKDAGDVLRLMRAADLAPVRGRLRMLLADPRCEAATRQGLGYLEQLFGGSGRQGVEMAVDALAGEVEPGDIRALAPAFTAALLRAAASQ